MTLYAIETKHPTTIFNSYTFNFHILNWCSIDVVTNDGPYYATFDVANKVLPRPITLSNW